MTDISLVEVRSKQVERIIFSQWKKWGKRNIAFLPAKYDGNGKALLRPFTPVNLVGRPSDNKPVVFRNLKIHDALLVNCCLRDNVGKNIRNGKQVHINALKHHLRIFNVVLIENTLSNCCIMSFEDFLLQPKKPEKPSRIMINSIIEFLKAYLSTSRRFETLVPDHRKDVFPEYIRSGFKISLIVCHDGIVIWFRRAIKKKRDSIKVSTIRHLSNVIPRLSADRNAFSLKDQSNVVVENLAIVTRGFANLYKIEGTVLKIPDEFGVLEVKSGSDIKLENVLLGYVDSRGRPRQIVLNGLWIFAKDLPSLFSADNCKERAQSDFFQHLFRSSEIKGEKLSRYQEADLAREINEVERSYFSLVSRENAEEPELQQFLERHPFILSPIYLDVVHATLDITPRARLSKGKRIVDFLVLFEPDLEKATRLVSIIEIKRPSHRLFTKKGKYSRPLRDGLEQIEEAFRVVEGNPKLATKLKLRSSDVVRGMVIIGRHSDLQKNELSYLEEFDDERIRIVTFDSLLRNLETVKDFYGVKGRQAVVVVGQKGTPDEDFTGTTEKTIQNALDYLAKRIT